MKKYLKNGTACGALFIAATVVIFIMLMCLSARALVIEQDGNLAANCKFYKHDPHFNSTHCPHK